MDHFARNSAIGLFVLLLLGAPLSLAARPILQAPVQISPSAETAQNVGIFRALDKITGRISTVEVPAGGQAVFGSLDVRLEYCRSRPAIETPETFAYLTIFDKGLDGQTHKEVFKGWMLASSPALNPLDHAVYDVWLINCRMVSGGAEIESR